MNRNLGQSKTFGAKFPRAQSLPIAFAYVRKNGTGEVRDFTVTVKTADLEAVLAANGQDVADAFIFANTILQHRNEAIEAKATKLNLEPEYRQVKINQNLTRFHLKGYFSAGRVAEPATVDAAEPAPEADVSQAAE